MDNDNEDFDTRGPNEVPEVKIAVVKEDKTEDDLFEINRVSMLRTKTVENAVPDPFAAKPEEVRKYAGIEDMGFKRKITNQIQKAYTGVDKAESSRIDESLQFSGYDIFGVVQPPYNLYAFTQLYELSAPHYAAVNAKVSNIVGLGYNFILSKKSARVLEDASNDAAKKKAQKDFEHAQAEHAAPPDPNGKGPAPRPPEDHTKKLDKIRRALAEHKDELEDQLESFNFEDSFSETLVKVWRDYEVTGNGYFEIGRTKAGKIGYVGHIPAHTVRVRKDRDGFVQIVQGRAQFFANFGDKKTRSPFNSVNSPNEIIHLKKYSPSQSYYGVPDIIAAQQAIAGNEYSAQYNLDYFQNKAVPRHVITLTGAKLGAQAEADLLAFFETGLKGSNHRSIFIPLPPAGPDGKPPELKFEPVEVGTQESSFSNFQLENDDHILMVHRVPKTKVSISSGASVAIAQDADKTFKEQVCAPEQRMCESKVNKIIDELTDAYDFKLNEMTLTDENTRSQINERYKKIGVFTTNEIRDTLGKPNIDGGDEIVDMNADSKMKAEENTNRQRDAERKNNQTDSPAATVSRNPKGAGRQQS